MKSSTLLLNRKQSAFSGIVLSIVTIAPLWLMMAAANTSAYAQTSSPSRADWTEFHRDNMQRWNPYETVLGINNVGRLQLKWKYPIGKIFSQTFLASSPAVVNGVVYSGSDELVVYALNASTGAKLWSFTTNGAVESSPAVVNGVVYIGSGDSNVYALNTSTGAKLWSYFTGNEVNSSPAVANGVVYISGGNGNMDALNANTGALLWSSPTGGGSPAVANGVVYVGCGYNVCALNASTGAKLWSFATGAAVYSSPAVVNGVVYITSNGNVYALNASTGVKLWSFFANVQFSSPAVANGVVYVGSDDGNVFALNASTGAKLWSFSTTPGPAVSSSPAIANGIVYVGGEDGNVYALNASTGARLWNYFIGHRTSSPTVVDGVLYIQAGEYEANANVYAFSVGSADLFLRINPSTTTVHQGDLLTYAFPVWNLGPTNADFEVLNTRVPAGTTLDYVRISGTSSLGTCTTPPYQGTGQIVCNEGAAMAPNTTWTVRLTVKVTAPAGTVITANAATMADTPDPNMANNTATVSLTVQ